MSVVGVREIAITPSSDAASSSAILTLSVMDGDLLCEFFSADADVSERRVDYTQGLEDKIKSMESEVSQSRQSISILSSNELHYKAWVQDLESA